jgi:hypothetical protein
LNHNRFPLVTAEFSPDFHSVYNPGLVELTMPMEYILSWLFNSHMENVRKTINDMIVYDPARIMRSDLETPGPGRLIRMKPEAYGQDVKSAIFQLQVNDITGAHLKDSEVILDLLQRVTAVSDNLMGLPIVGGRRTATEVRGVRELSANRLQTLAQLISSQAFQPWTEQMVANTLQLMERDLFIRLEQSKGADPASQFLHITPEDIYGEFDFLPIDASIPIDRVDLGQVWKEILLGVAQSPELSGQLDLFEIFKKTCEIFGVKNIDQFRRSPDQMAQMAAAQGQPGGANVRVAPDQQVEDQVRKGNAVPIKPGVDVGSQRGGDLGNLAAMLGPLAGARNGRG